MEQAETEFDRLLELALASGVIDAYDIEGTIVTLRAKGASVSVRTEYAADFLRAMIGGHRPSGPPGPWNA